MEFCIAIEKLSNTTLQRLREDAEWDDIAGNIRDDEEAHKI